MRVTFLAHYNKGGQLTEFERTTIYRQSIYRLHIQPNITEPRCSNVLSIESDNLIQRHRVLHDTHYCQMGTPSSLN